MATGAEKLQALRDAGVSEADIAAYQQRATVALQSEGLPQQEIDAFWNPPRRPPTGLDAHLQENLTANAPTGEEIAKNPIQAFAAGWNMSASDVAARVASGNRKVGMVLPEDARLMDKLTFMAGRVVGDLPATVSGFVAGGVAGAAVPIGGETGVTELIGGGFGAAALPESMRQVYTESLGRGKITSFGDLMERSTRATVNTLKQGFIGAVTAPIGGAVGGKVLSTVGSKGLSLAADATTQAVTGTAIGGAMDGHVPDAEDFTAAAILALGFHSAGASVGAAKRFIPNSRADTVARNSRAIYAKTGIPPWEQVQRAAKDPALKQELLSEETNGTPAVREFGKLRLRDPDPYKPPVQETNVAGKPKAAAAVEPPAGLRELVVYAENTAGYAKAHQVDPNQVVSHAGAIGVHQIMPDTARQYMGKDFDVSTLADPAVNEKVANKIVADLAKRFKLPDGTVDVEAVLIGYNAGPGRASEFIRKGRSLSVLPLETQKYLQRAEGFKGQIDRGAPVGQDPTGVIDTQTERLTKFRESLPEGDPRRPQIDMVLQQLQTLRAKEGTGGPPEEPPAPPARSGGGGDEPPRFTPETVAMLTPEDLSGLVRAAIADRDQPSLIRTGMSLVTKAYADYVNERIAAKGLGLEDQFQSLNASRSRAHYFMTKGTIEDPVTFAAGSDESYMGAYKLAKKNGGTKNGFLEYRLAKQAVADAARGMKTAIDPVVAKAVADAGERKYGEADAMVNRVKEGALRYAQKAGVYSEAQVNAFVKENPSHIVQQRDLGEAELATGRGPGLKVRTVKKKTGSERQIVEPQRADIENLGSIIANADRNVALRSLIARTPEELAALGIKRVEEAAAPGVELKTVGPRTKNDFIVYQDGKAVTYTVEGNPELVKMIHGATAPEAGVIGKIANTFAAFKRAGVVNMVDFLFRNLFRDQLTASILAKHGGLPMQDLIAGVYHSVFSPDIVKEYARAGGFGAALNEMDTNYFQHDIDKVFRETGTWGAVTNALPSAIHAWHTAVTRLDALGRIGDYARGRGRGEAPLAAAMSSRRNRLDFAQRGASGLLGRMAAATPFLRPVILGHEQIVRAFTERPVTTTAKAALYITAPTIGLYLLNEIADQSLPDEQKYDKVPRWQRDLFWVTPPINGVRLLLPKPFVIGQLFGSLPERMLDHYRANKPDAYKEWVANFLGTLTVPVMPAIAEPVVENMANLDTMNFKPLVPESLRDASNYMQYSPNTSDTAIELSRALGPAGAKLVDVSPIVLQNYVRSWAGSVGNAALSIVDGRLAPANDVKELKDNPFIAGFVTRNLDMGAAPIQDFYDNMARITAKHRDVKLAIERQDPREIDFTTNDAEAFMKVTQVTTAMSKMQATIRATRYDPDMTADEKRQYIEGIYSDMLVLAADANDSLKGVE